MVAREGLGACPCHPWQVKLRGNQTRDIYKGERYACL